MSLRTLILRGIGGGGGGGEYKGQGRDRQRRETETQRDRQRQRWKLTESGNSHKRCPSWCHAVVWTLTICVVVTLTHTGLPVCAIGTAGTWFHILKSIKDGILTLWGRARHTCVSKLPSLVQIMACPAPSHYLNQCWIIVNWSLGKKFNEILIEINTFSFKKMHLKMYPSEWRTFLPGGIYFGKKNHINIWQVSR